MGEMNIVFKKIDEVIPYEKNPRRNEEAVDSVAESIKQFGFRIPIVLDSEGIIVAGHTRLKAAKKIGLETVPCIVADDLSEEQVRAFRLADNKSGEIATWDEELLQQELAEILNIDMQLFGFEEGETDFADEVQDDTYTMKTNIPQYEITGECPDITELYDTEKTNKLIEEIMQSGVTEEQKEFLLQAARRHTVFNYRNIAEYYAHSDEEMQELMEKSALVIIDMDNAIANGYATLFSDVLDTMEDGENA